MVLFGTTSITLQINENEANKKKNRKNETAIMMNVVDCFSHETPET